MESIYFSSGNFLCVVSLVSFSPQSSLFFLELLFLPHWTPSGLILCVCLFHNVMFYIFLLQLGNFF